MRKAILLILIVMGACAAHGQVTSFVRPRPKSAPAGDPLKNGLRAFYNLDEQSGTRYDAIGSSNLQDNNTVLYSAGKKDNAADFTRSNNESLSCADNAALSISANTGFTIAAWVKPDQQEWMTVLGKNSTYSYEDLSVSEYGIYTYWGTPTFYACDGTTFTEIQHATSLTTGSWAFLIGWYNPNTDSLYFRINNGTPQRVAASHGTSDRSNGFYIGSWGSYSSGGQWDGAIDLVGVWARYPVSSNKFGMADSLYNSGNGWKP